MQTFLPYPDFVASVKALDYRRLGKQRVEAMQLVNSTNKLAANPNAKVGWMNHPARTMWIGHMNALKLYHNVCIQEWIDRGYKNTMKFYDLPDDITLPTWIGDDRVHASHRSNLLRKDPAYYAVHGWTEPDDIEYYWPVL
jgi:hypothetical protein